MARTPCDDPVAQLPAVLDLPIQVAHRQAGGFTKAHDAGDVLGAGSPAALVPAAVDQRRDPHALADEKRADALGAVELVRGERKQVDVQVSHVEGHVPDGLHGVGVEEHIALPADGADLGHGLDGPDLVVGVHDRDQDGLVGDRLADIVRVDEAVGVDGQIGNLDASLLEELGGVQHRVVLDGGGDDVVALLLAGKADPKQGLVVGLGSAAGEDDLFRERA